jgi:hypothetical protein
MNPLSRWNSRRRPDRARRLAAAPALDPLETRRVCFVGPMIAVAAPNILAATGGYVPVHVSGLLDDTATLDKIGASYRVTDEYRTVEPSGPVTLTSLGSNTIKFPARSNGKYVSIPANYSFNFTVYVQATRSNQVFDGRHYYINIAIEDPDDGNTETIAVLVPRGNVKTRQA